jgi:glycosyltransferase involved in cell wall biosynthesis
MRVCVVYDCLFPYTVGGAERWYRALAERLAAQGHEVTYLTLRQWDRGQAPELPGVRVRVVGPRMALYDGPGHRRILPPLVFGAGVLAHLARHGRHYDVVHTCAFPYFSLLAAASCRRAGGYRLIVDWFEVWSREYWHEYLGRLGEIGRLVQRACIRVRQRAQCFSALYADRLRAEGFEGEITMLAGAYDGPRELAAALPAEPRVVFAGRHIPEKGVPAIPPAIAVLHERMPEIRATIFGDGPEREATRRQIARLGLQEIVALPGFVATEEIDAGLARALCLLLPSRREGYGLVVVEAAAHGTPSVVVSGPDNAAVELIEEGVNGVIAADTSPPALADAIARVAEGGEPMRATTRRWFEDNVERMSLACSLEIALSIYGEAAARA